MSNTEEWKRHSEMAYQEAQKKERSERMRLDRDKSDFGFVNRFDSTGRSLAGRVEGEL